MLKMFEKVSYIFAFIIFFFINNVCQVLYFVVEDHFEDLITKPYFLIESDYWGATVTIFCLGIFALIFSKNPSRVAANRFFSQILFAILAVIAVFQTSQILRNVVYGTETWADLWNFLISIMSVLLYVSFGYLAEKKLDGNKKASYLISGIIVTFFVVSYCCASYYMPRDVMKTIKQDSVTLSAVAHTVKQIKSGLDFDQLPDNVQVKDENGKKVVSWKLVTDFEKLKKDGKFTKRIKDKIVSTSFKKWGDRIKFEFHNQNQKIIVNVPKRRARS